MQKINKLAQRRLASGGIWIHLRNPEGRKGERREGGKRGTDEGMNGEKNEWVVDGRCKNKREEGKEEWRKGRRKVRSERGRESSTWGLNE